MEFKRNDPAVLVFLLTSHVQKEEHDLFNFSISRSIYLAIKSFFYLTIYVNKNC